MNRHLPRSRAPFARLAVLPAALLALTPGLLGAAVHADPPGHSSAGGRHDTPPGHAQGKDKGAGKGAGTGTGQHRGHGHGPDHVPGAAVGHGRGDGTGKDGAPGRGRGGKGQGRGAGAGVSGQADPPGNNGTVKIAGIGDLDGVPDNTPHPGCTLVIEWYGFDEGPDVVSTVTFAMQAPTADTQLTVEGPTEVFVGGDPATGAGTPTGLDGRESYTLTFDGVPHPQQGYHVRLTVATPRANGNDTKSKVFWIEPCAGTQTPAETPVPSTGADIGTGTTTADSSTQDDAPGPAISLSGAAPAADTATTPAAVPDAVDAGDGGTPIVSDLTSPSGLLTVLVVVLAAGAAALVLRRARG